MIPELDTRRSSECESDAGFMRRGNVTLISRHRAITIRTTDSSKFRGRRDGSRDSLRSKYTRAPRDSFSIHSTRSIRVLIIQTQRLSSAVSINVAYRRPG